MDSCAHVGAVRHPRVFRSQVEGGVPHDEMWSARRREWEKTSKL